MKGMHGYNPYSVVCKLEVDGHKLERNQNNSEQNKNVLGRLDNAPIADLSVSW